MTKGSNFIALHLLSSAGCRRLFLFFSYLDIFSEITCAIWKQTWMVLFESLFFYLLFRNKKCETL